MSKQPRRLTIIDKTVNTIMYVNCLIVIMIGAVLAIILSVEVFFRYVLNSSLFFVEELSRVLFIWFSLLGANIALHEKAHIGFDLIKNKLSAIAAKTVAYATIAVMLFYCGYLFYGMALVLPKQRIQMFGSLNFSLFWSYVSISIGMVFMGIRLLYSLLCLVRDEDENVRSVVDMFTFNEGNR